MTKNTTKARPTKNQTNKTGGSGNVLLHRFNSPNLGGPREIRDPKRRSLTCADFLVFHRLKMVYEGCMRITINLIPDGTPQGGDFFPRA